MITNIEEINTIDNTIDIQMKDNKNEDSLNKENENISISKIKDKLILINNDLTGYFNEYNKHLNESKENTFRYISIFEEIINDYTLEINSNCSLLNEVFTRLDSLSCKLPLLEDLYEKVHEMRIILEMIYASIKKKI